MLKNYLKIASRNIIKYKGNSFINIIGLAFGMASAMLIFLWIFNQFSYDSFHENKDRIYRVCVDLKAGTHMIYPYSMPPLKNILINEYPDVENAARIARPRRVSIKYKDKFFSEELVCYADNSLFEVFTFPFIQGHPANALNKPYALVITETMAKKYFGNNNPLGEIFKIDGNTDYTITGVVKDVPVNSHFKFNMVRSYETLYAENRDAMESWFHIQFYTYLLLKDSKSVKTLMNKFPDLVDRYLGEQLKSIGGTLRFFLQPLNRIHLYSDLSAEIAPQSDITYVYLFISIALLILLLTIINFINLTTARSSIRANEIAVRKTFGSLRRNINFQFLSESVFLCIVSLLFAGVLFSIFISFFRNSLGYEFHIKLTAAPWIISGFILLATITGLLAGIYPAFYLSSFNPIQIFQNRQIISNKGSKFRNYLILIQFIISIIMIIGIITIYKQINYMKSKKLGFKDENVVIIPGVQDILKHNSFNTLQNEFLNLPGIFSVAGANLMPGTGIQKGLLQPEGFPANNNQLMEFLYVDPSYIPTLGIKIKTGRNFSKKYSSDPDNSIIINETAARKFGWINTIGKEFIFQSEDNAENQTTYRQVIGVIKDFHSSSLHNRIEPLAIFYNIDRINYLALKISSDNINNTLKVIEKKWKKFSPDKQFRSFFLDRIFNRLYVEEERLGKLVLCFSILTVFIGCLGLFGLINFLADRQRKNIGIRKVYGASIKDIVNMYVLDISKYVLIANLIAWPIAYYFINKWLQNFVYQTSVNFGVYLASGALIFVITILTISYQTIKAATANPVESLRYE